MHNITERDGVFTVREPAWHGLSTVFEDYPTRKEAQRLVHNWEPISEPLYRKEILIPIGVQNDGVTPWSPTEQYVEIKDSVLNVRSDTHESLGVVSSTYEAVTNDEMWDIAEALQGEDADVKFETGGSLKGGRKVWILMRLNEPLILPGDPNGHSIPYYALQNAHDGSGAFRGQATMTRIVCDNTSKMADLDAEARDTEFVFRHTKNVRQRVDEAKQALLGWRESVAEWKLLSEHFYATAVDESQKDIFIQTFIPMPTADIITERVRGNIYNARGDFYAILAGPTCKGIENTAWGLISAAVEYSQHYRKSRNDETLFQRAYLDRSKLVSHASDILRNYLEVV